MRRTLLCGLAWIGASLFGVCVLPAQEDAPFGEQHPALDGFATGRWWEKEWSGKGENWLRELRDVPRAEALAFALYTLERGVLKLSAQCFPLLPEEPREVVLEIEEQGVFRERGRAEVLYPGWSAHFRVEGWDATRSARYRVRLGALSTFEGTLRADPGARDEVRIALLSCNSNADRTPRADIVANLRTLDPDLVFCAGDQSYDHKQHTAAWLLFGQQFRELFRDRPCVTIPDDHDVGHGNLWGEGGAAAPAGTNGDHGGYVLPASYVRMVERCQTAHLPEPFEATPVQQGIGVYYTRLRIGGIDCAILEDRKWKTAPGGVLPQRGPRPDHVNDPEVRPEDLEHPELELLGERQLRFLEAWGADWSGAEMKVALSQTNFCGAVTHHGSPEQRLLADLDCNGWPRAGRDAALRALRRAHATHLCGDQHLAVVVRHGIEAFDDGPFAFCGPAIQNDYYGRWWKPELAQRAGEALSSALPWSGRFRDGFGNRFTLHAYANPDRPRAGFDAGNGRGDGFGLARFQKSTRHVVFEAYRRGAELSAPERAQYPGWPVRFRADENDGRAEVAHLPTLRFDRDDPVIAIVDEESGERLASYRLHGRVLRPGVPSASASYRVLAGHDRAERLIYRGPASDATIEVRLGATR
ncbi:MAG: hypothetical protein IPN34_11835 [Planctomycetes bacterium]|nr:hypothetical protein [Planctomycetota bacterium]